MVHIHFLLYRIGYNMKIINLKPAIFSKSQTVADISQKIIEYPEQRNNTPKALDGLTIEFVDYDGPDYGQPVGTLSEIAEVSKANSFVINTRDGDSMVVEKIDNKFYVLGALFENA